MWEWGTVKIPLDTRERHGWTVTLLLPLGVGPNLWLPFPRVWIPVRSHGLQRPRGGGLNHVVALKMPHSCPDTAAPEPSVDPLPRPGGSWLEHRNNAHPMPAPKVTSPPPGFPGPLGQKPESLAGETRQWPGTLLVAVSHVCQAWDSEGEIDDQCVLEPCG